MNSENITIALFVHSLDDHGAARVALNLAQGFLNSLSPDIKVELVLTRGGGVFLQQVPPKVEIVNLNASKSPVIFNKFIALWRYFRRRKPTFLIAIGDNINLAGMAQRLSGSRTIVLAGVHNYLSLYIPNEHRSFKRILPYLLRWSFSQCEQIIAVSQGVAEDLASTTGLPLERIKVIYNPVISLDFLEKAEEPVNHPWLGSKEIPVILGAGRFVKQKDFSTLIRAFALVRQQRLARLIIIGQGAEQFGLEQLVHDLNLDEDVDFPGFVENPYAYMSRARVFVLSSAWEGFGNVIVEAMATGTAVVSTDCPSGPSEILENGKYGQLVPVGDFEALAHAILLTLENPISSPVLKQKAQDFSIELIVEQYLNVMKDILNRRIRSIQ